MKKKAAFFCANCREAVPPGAESCPNCGLSFSGVRCPSCGHQGPEKDFLAGCPSCGYLADKLREAVPPGPVPTTTPVPTNTTGKQKQRKRSLPGWFVRGATILLFFLLLLGLIVLYRRVSY